MNAKTIRQQLETIANNEPFSLRAYVAQEALDYTVDNPEVFFRDLMNCGCACGSIPGLMHLADTRTFYDQHYFEIEDIREEYEDSLGEPIRIKGDLKNFFAWFAFEESAYQMANEMELGV